MNTKDNYRPTFHFTIDGLGFPGDPNAMFFADGRFHMMYVYDRASEDYCWGHVSTTDFVHWLRHQDALVPDENDSGIYSGGVYLDGEVAYVLYWALGRQKGQGGIRLARAEGPRFEKWVKDEDYAIASSDLGVVEEPGAAEGYSNFRGCADPSNIWKSGGRYFAQLGNLCALNKNRNNPNAPQEAKGDWSELIVSEDLHHWRYLHRFYQRRQDNSWTGVEDDNMCPVFLPLIGKNGSQEYLEMFLSHNVGAQYYLGNYDEIHQVFLPQAFGKLSMADNVFFAPEMAALPDGRVLLTGWLRDNIDDDLVRERALGWSGVHALFREVTLGKENALEFAPLKEYSALRGPGIRLSIPGLQEAEIPLFGGHAEICFQTKMAASFSFLYEQGDGRYSEIGYDKERGEIFLDTRFSGSLGRKIRDFMKVDSRSINHLQFFIDGPCLDLFFNGQALCRRVFVPESSLSKPRLLLKGEGQDIEGSVYPMNPIFIEGEK